jgi:hypothetical protein
MARSWNLFRIGRRPADEDQLTEMLVWLAEAVPEVAEALLRLAFGDRRVQADEIQLTTQHGISAGRLDALVTSAELALIVESKLGSTYGDDQIARYLAWLDSTFAERPLRGLLTITAQEANWPAEDIAFAASRGITGSACLWGDLYELLEPLTDETAEDGLAPQLVREFRDMLSDEGLVPLQPLDPAELGTAWADSWRTVRRFRDFFHPCKARIGEVLGAEQVSSSWSDRGDWFWQDYGFDDGTRIVVGLFYTDEFERIPTSMRTGSPILFLAVKADHVDDWPSLATAMEAHPPEEWTTGNRWWNERPSIWRPLLPLISATSFEEQREQLAAAVKVARPWFDAALVDRG